MTIAPFLAARYLCAMAACAALAACGGGKDEELEQRAFATADRNALYGDWPHRYYVVRDQAAWDAAWAERRSALDCTLPRNTTACATTRPPVVDFDRYMVVGMYVYVILGTNPPPSIVQRAGSGNIEVSFQWNPIFSPPFLPRPGPDVYFVMVPRRDAPVVFMPASPIPGDP